MNKSKSESVIHFDDIRRYYEIGDETVKALSGINLSINRGEYVSIMGPSGSGKSTLMNITGCLDTPTHGTYILNGSDVSQLPDHELAAIRNREIGFVFQTFNLLNQYSALENVMLPLVYSGVPRPERIERAKEALTHVGLGERMQHKPNEMSGGQRQRVAIARALVNKPAIILADEPTGNLDSKTSVEIMKIFQEIHRQGNTIVLVTHEEDIAQHSHRIVRILDGKIEYDIKNEQVIELN